MNVLQKTCQETTKNSLPSVVVFTTGSMNPLHIGHTKMLELASDHFENLGYQVLGRILSPSDAIWSRGKPFGFLENQSKLDLCHLGVSDRIVVDDWEISQPNPIDFPAVRDHLAELLGQKVSVKYVCGADHALKCDLYMEPWCVIVGRPGQQKHPPATTCKATCIDGESCESSTAIRKAIRQHKLESVRHMLHPAVYERLACDGEELFARPRRRQTQEEFKRTPV